MAYVTEPLAAASGVPETGSRLLAARQACYKCNMRRWMRDRGKRRKPQDGKPGQENPAPLQPKFPDPTAADADCSHLISSIRNGNANTVPFPFLGIASSSDDQLRCAKLWVANKFPPSDKPIWQGDRYNHD